MIATSMSAIPIYMALLKFVLPARYVPTLGIGRLPLVPAVLFLAAGVVFLISYFPQRAVASLDLPDEIENEGRRMVENGHRLSVAGFTVFCLAVVSGLTVTGYMLRMPAQRQTARTKEKETTQVTPDAAKQLGPVALWRAGQFSHTERRNDLWKICRL